MATLLSPAAPAKAEPRFAVDVRYLLYFYLHITGFLATTLLLTWGLFVLFFLAIGGFSLDGMMQQLANISTRYIAADAGRVGAFKAVVGTAHLLLSVAVIFFRRKSLLPPNNTEARRHHA